MNTPMRLVMVSARAVLLVTVVVSWWMTPDGYGSGPGEWQHNISHLPGQTHRGGGDIKMFLGS